MKKSVKKLTAMGFFAITIVMVMDLHEFTVFATSGLSLIFYLIVGGILWFIPIALCSAEMATITSWEKGGIFTWVENTLGKRLGFAAVFFQWFQVTVGFITMLYFVFSTLTTCFGLDYLDSSPMFTFLGIMIIFWTLTLAQLGGIKRTEVIGRIGLIAGIFVPCTVLAILSIAYIAGGNPLEIEISLQSLIPDFSQPATLVVFVAFVLSYAGIEASASYVGELENPQRHYPRVILLVVLAAIIFNTIGGISIAIIVPDTELSLSGGIVQALISLVTHFNPSFVWLAQVLALLIAVGVISEIASWVMGPIRSMYFAAQQGFLPKVFKKVNKQHIPVPLVLTQGIVVTIWAALLTFGGGGQNLSFLVAISLTVAIYLVAYTIMLIGYFVVVFKHKKLERSYEVPGGKIGKCLMAGCGLVITLIALVITFIPPSSLEVGQTGIYRTILAIGFILTLSLPFIMFAFRDKHVGHLKVKHFRSHDVDAYVDPIARGEHHIIPEQKDIYTH